MDFAPNKSHFSQGCSSSLAAWRQASSRSASRSKPRVAAMSLGTTIHRFGPGHLATHLSSSIIIITIIMLNILINNDSSITKNNDDTDNY